jgi:hypothetical protein
MSIFTDINGSIGFGSWAQYRDVARTISRLIEEGLVEKIDVPDIVAEHTPTERWYRELSSGIVVRCVPPGPSNSGLWQEININETAS